MSDIGIIATASSETAPPLLQGGPSTARLFDETVRYLIVSALALIADYGLLVGLTQFAGLHYLVSAAIGFLCGLVLTYFLSVKFVFRVRRLTNPKHEFLIFAGIGLCGLAMNEMVMGLLVGGLGLGFAFAKLPTAGVSFLFNFGMRRALLFTRMRRSR